jgi:hypothetical protein
VARRDTGPPADLRPTGPIQSSLLARTWQLRLDKQLVAADIAQDQQWTDLLAQQVPNLTNDSFMPNLGVQLGAPESLRLRRGQSRSDCSSQRTASRRPSGSRSLVAHPRRTAPAKAREFRSANAGGPTPERHDTSTRATSTTPRAFVNTGAWTANSWASTAIALSELEVGSCCTLRMRNIGSLPRVRLRERSPARIDWLRESEGQLFRNRGKQWTSGCCTGFPRLP